MPQAVNTTPAAAASTADIVAAVAGKSFRLTAARSDLEERTAFHDAAEDPLAVVEITFDRAGDFECVWTVDGQDAGLENPLLHYVSFLPIRDAVVISQSQKALDPALREVQINQIWRRSVGSFGTIGDSRFAVTIAPQRETGGLILRVPREALELTFERAFDPVGANLDLADALRNEYFADARLVSRDGDVAAHAVVLRCRLPFVNIESCPGKVVRYVFEPFHAKTVRQLLHYVYTGSTPPLLAQLDRADAVTEIADLERLAREVRLPALSELCKSAVAASSALGDIHTLIDQILGHGRNAVLVLRSLVQPEQLPTAQVEKSIHTLLQLTGMAGVKLLLALKDLPAVHNSGTKEQRREFLRFLRAKTIEALDLGHELADRANRATSNMHWGPESELARHIIAMLRNGWLLGIELLETASDCALAASSAPAAGAGRSLKSVVLARKVRKIRDNFVNEVPTLRERRNRYEALDAEEQSARMLDFILDVTGELGGLMKNIHEARSRFRDLPDSQFRTGMRPLFAVLSQAVGEVERMLEQGHGDGLGVRVSMLMGDYADEFTLCAHKLGVATVRGRPASRGAAKSSRTEPAAKPDALETMVDLGGALDGWGSDIVLLVEDERIAAHKAVLAARAEYFRSAFLSGMKEATAAEMELVDTSVAPVRALIAHIYTGVLPADTQVGTLMEVIALADRLQAGATKTAAEAAIVTALDTDVSLSVEAAADCVIFAEQHRAQALKEAAMQVMVENWDEVVNSDSFHALDEELRNEVVAFRTQAEERATSESRNTACAEVAVVDAKRLEETMDKALQVLGDGIDQDEMRTHILAANFNLERAINFFYASLHE